MIEIDSIADMRGLLVRRRCLLGGVILRDFLMESKLELESVTCRGHTSQLQFNSEKHNTFRKLL